MRRWLARQLARLVAWLAKGPVVATRQASAEPMDAALDVSAGFFKITQRIGDATTVVHRGDSGSVARREWERLCANRPAGVLRFLHNGQERGRYSAD